MIQLLVTLIAAFLLYGGLGFRYRERLGQYYASGTIYLGLLVEIFVMLALFGAIRL